jgi:hypothetical protein
MSNQVLYFDNHEHFLRGPGGLMHVPMHYVVGLEENLFSLNGHVIDVKRATPMNNKLR